MAEGLNYSVLYYADSNDEQKTKQKNAQLCFAQKTLRLTKNHPDDNDKVLGRIV